MHSISCHKAIEHEFLSLFLVPIADFICADISLSSLGKNSFNSYTDSHSKWNLVSNVTTQIGTHAYLPCKVSVDVVHKSHTRLTKFRRLSRVFWVIWNEESVQNHSSLLRMKNSHKFYARRVRKFISTKGDETKNTKFGVFSALTVCEKIERNYKNGYNSHKLHPYGNLWVLHLFLLLVVFLASTLISGSIFVFPAFSEIKINKFSFLAKNEKTSFVSQT